MNFGGLAVSDSFEIVSILLDFIKFLKLFLFLVVVHWSYQWNDSYCQ